MLPPKIVYILIPRNCEYCASSPWGSKESDTTKITHSVTAGSHPVLLMLGTLSFQTTDRLIYKHRFSLLIF